MSVSQRTAQTIRDRLLSHADVAKLKASLASRMPAVDPLCDRVPHGNDHSAAGLEKRQAFLRQRVEPFSRCSNQISPDALLTALNGFGLQEKHTQ